VGFVGTVRYPPRQLGGGPGYTSGGMQGYRRDVWGRSGNGILAL